MALGLCKDMGMDDFDKFYMAVHGNPEWRAKFDKIAPIVIWMVAGVDEDSAFGISAN